MKQMTTILSGVMLALALTLVVSACAKRTEKAVAVTPTTPADVRESKSPTSSTAHTGNAADIALASAVETRLASEGVAKDQNVRVDSDHGTVYLKGSVDTPEKNKRAGEVAAAVPGVTSVVNQLHVGPNGAMVEPAGTSQARSDAGMCSLVNRNSAMRTETMFGPIQVRVFDDVASPLNQRKNAKPLTAAEEIRALEQQKGRPLTEAELRSLEAKRMQTSTGADVVSSTKTSQRTLTAAEIRDLEVQKGRPLTEAEIHGLESSAPALAEAPGGETGGKQQETGSAQQAGTSQEIGRSQSTSSKQQLALTEQDKLTTEQRVQLYGDEARIADRRGDLLWSGWLKPNETVQISSVSRPIRYDYRFIVDEHFHGEQGAWCNNNVISMP